MAPAAVLIAFEDLQLLVQEIQIATASLIEDIEAQNTEDMRH